MFPNNFVVTGVKRSPAHNVSMERDRDEAGQYVEQVTIDSVLEVFETAEIPVLTANEVAEALDCSRPAAYNKLDRKSVV